MLVHVFAQARSPVLLPDVLVVRHAREQVVTPGRDVGVVRPLLSLQRHVALLFVVLQAIEQDRHAMSGRVLEREGDEDEAHAEVGQVIPSDGVLLVVPLERRRVIERKARSRETLANLAAELLCRAALGGRKFAPQEVGYAAVEIAQAALDGELYPALRLRRLGGGDGVRPRDDDEVLVA